MMSSERQVPGYQYLNEVGSAQEQVPGGPYVNETVSGSLSGDLTDTVTFTESRTGVPDQPGNRTDTVTFSESATGSTDTASTRTETVTFTSTQTGVEAPCDPYFTSVGLLLHGDGNLNDSGPLALSPSTTGAITTVADGSAFGGYEISWGSGSKQYARYDKGSAFMSDPTGAFTLECFITINSNPSCGTSGGASNDRGGFIRMLTGSADAGTQDLMLSAVCVSGTQYINWIYGSSGAIKRTTWVQSDRHYVAWTRDNSGNNQFWLDGTLIDTITNSSSVSAESILVGNSSGDNPVGGLIEEVRFTPGIKRDVSVVPTAAFPDIQCVSNQVTDTVTFSHSQTAIQDFSVTRSETVTFTESETGTTGTDATRTETVTFTESRTAILDSNVTVSETVTLTESSTWTGTFPVSQTDTVTFSSVQSGFIPGVAILGHFGGDDAWVKKKNKASVVQVQNDADDELIIELVMSLLVEEVA